MTAETFFPTQTNATSIVSFSSTNQNILLNSIYSTTMMPTTTLDMFVLTTPNPQLEAHILMEYARKIYMWLIPVMVFVLSIAVIGNGVIVLSAPWLTRPINPYHRLCVSLAAADMWVAVLIATGLIVNSYIPVVLRIAKKDNCVAATLEIFRISGMLTSNLHIFALAVHQYVGIVFPLRYKMIITTRRQRCLILVMWLLPLAFILSWFVSIPGDGFRSPSCRMNFYGRLPFRLSVFISFIVPFFGTFALYGTLLITFMRAKAKCQNDLRRSMHENYRRRVKSNLKLVWTTMLILSTFTMSWGLCVLYFVLVCMNGCVFVFQRNISYILLGSSVNFLVMLKLVMNPLIYALRMKHIRKSVTSCFLATCFACCCRFKFANTIIGINSSMANRGKKIENEYTSRRLNFACDLPSESNSRFEKLMRLRRLSNQSKNTESRAGSENVRLLALTKEVKQQNSITISNHQSSTN